MIEAITGRYMRLELEGRAHRLYFEEAGQGIPLLLLHTAGSDGRQWRARRIISLMLRACPRKCCRHHANRKRWGPAITMGA